MRFIDNYDVILLDVQMTFMFDVDRFGEDEDFHATYLSLGGSVLSPDTVNTAVSACVKLLWKLYKDPAWFDKFPSLAEGFNASNPELKLPSKEWALLEETFAIHERGHVPKDHADSLRELAKTHRLGVVSNIWAKKDAWIREFQNMEIIDLFEIMIFSSDHTSIKPSPILFNMAISAFDTDRSRIVFVGDNPAYDIKGARAAGLDVILTTNGSPIDQKFDPMPDFAIKGIPYLLTEQSITK